MDENTHNSTGTLAVDQPDHAFVGLRLREAREYLGLSQESVAEKLKMSRAALSAAETGKRKVSGIELDAFSKIYGRPVDFFLGREPGETTEAGAMPALFRATSELTEGEREQVLRFAQFLRHVGAPSRRSDDSSGE